MKKLIQMSDINFKDSPRTRDEINADAVEEYRNAYEQGGAFPLPVLYHMAGLGLIVADGMHRLKALTENHADQVVCEVREGALEDCIRASVMGNLHHGVRRTNADKRQSVITAIELLPEVSDLKIAEVCAVSHTTVTQLRKTLESKGAIEKRETIVSQDGKKRKSNTTKTEEKAITLPDLQPEKAVIDTQSVTHNSTASACDSKAAVIKSVLSDCTGYPVPEKAQIVWGRKAESEHLSGLLREVRLDISRRREAKDILFAEVNMTALELEILACESRLNRAIPYAVCPMCQGKLPENCTCCGGRGVISKFKFENGVPEDVKMSRAV